MLSEGITEGFLKEGEPEQGPEGGEDLAMELWGEEHPRQECWGQCLKGWDMEGNQKIFLFVTSLVQFLSALAYTTAARPPWFPGF